MRDEELEIDERMASFLEALHETLAAPAPQAQQGTSADANDRRLQEILHAAEEVLEMIERVRSFEQLRAVLRTVMEESPNRERRPSGLSGPTSDGCPAAESTADRSDIHDEGGA